MYKNTNCTFLALNSFYMLKKEIFLQKKIDLNLFGSISNLRRNKKIESAGIYGSDMTTKKSFRGYFSTKSEPACAAPLLRSPPRKLGHLAVWGRCHLPRRFLLRLLFKCQMTACLVRFRGQIIMQQKIYGFLPRFTLYGKEEINSLSIVDFSLVILSKSSAFLIRTKHNISSYLN